MSCRPNRATGTRTPIYMQEEPCWATLATDQQPIGVEYASETLINDISTIESNLIRGDRMRAHVKQGHKRPGGEINGELQPNGFWPLIFKHALGGDVVTNGSGPYTHSLMGSPELPQGLTLQKKFGFPDGTTFKRLAYLGARVGELGIVIPNEGIVTARAMFLAREEQELESADIGDPLTPIYADDNEPFNSFHGALMMDLEGDGTRAAIATIASMDLTLNNSIDGEQFALDGTHLRADLPEDLRIINGNLVAFFTDTNWALYQAFINDTKLSLDITLSRANYAMQITIPSFKVRGQVTPRVGGRGPLNLEIQYEAARDEELGTDILVAITNNDPALSTEA